MPIVAACRADVPMDSNTLRRVPDKHGNLQRNTAALDEVEGILTASPIIVKAARPVALRVDAPDFALAGEDITIQVTPAEPTRQAIRLTVTSETGTLIEARLLRPSGGTITRRRARARRVHHRRRRRRPSVTVRAGKQRHPHLG